MADNVKLITGAQRPPSGGWAPQTSLQRLNSGLDGATGNLTGDQQRVAADLPKEEWEGVTPSRHHITVDQGGGCDYSANTPVGDRWGRMATADVTVTAAGRL